jgi:hypothetical protein
MLRNRTISVQIEINPGEILTYNQDYNIKVNVNKTALATYNECNIEISNLNRDVRNNLLSNFTLFQRRVGQTPFVPIRVFIGREGQTPGKADNLRQIFEGYILTCDISPPPEMILTINAGTAVINKTKWNNKFAPKNSRVDAVAKWIADLLGLTPDLTALSPAIAAQTIPNFRWAATYEALITSFMQLNRGTVAVYIDDNRLVVQEFGNISKAHPVYELNSTTSMIGVPSWTEWGAKATALADTPLFMGQGIRIKSEVNPNFPGINTMVINKLGYELTTRDNPWYVHVHAGPSSQVEITQ